MLLCARHHRAVHHHGWEVTIAADGATRVPAPAGITPTNQACATSATYKPATD